MVVGANLIGAEPTSTTALRRTTGPAQRCWVRRDEPLRGSPSTARRRPSSPGSGDAAFL